MSASWLMISTLVSFSSSIGMSSGSSSMAVTFFTILESGIVRMPRPGPISMTWSFPVSFAVLRIWLTTVLDLRKFWPRDFFGL